MGQDADSPAEQAKVLERFKEEVTSGRKIQCMTCGQTALPLPADDGKTARMCMCFGIEWESPRLDDSCELPQQWEWL